MKFLLLIKTYNGFEIISKFHLLKVPKKEKAPKPEWRLTPENEKKLEDVDVEFAFEQAEKQLSGTVDEANVLITRTSILLGVYIGFETSIAGFIIREINSEVINYNFLIVAILAFIYLGIYTINLLKNFKGHKYATSGSEPIYILDEYYVLSFTDKEKRKVAFYLNEIRAYQFRIEKNKETNLIRWGTFEQSLKQLVYFPFLLAIVFIIIKLISTIL
jgi:hypothetical protein